MTINNHYYGGGGFGYHPWYHPVYVWPGHYAAVPALEWVGLVVILLIVFGAAAVTWRHW